MSRRKLILVVLVCLFLLSLSAAAYLDFYFAGHNPRSPQAETGRVYREVANKTEVYLTRRELIISRLVAMSWVIWFAAIFYFGLRWKFTRLADGASPSQIETRRKKQR